MTTSQNPDALKEENTPAFDEGTSKRIHEHLNNQHDEISEDDIRNVRTSMEDGETDFTEADHPIVSGKHLKDKIKDDRDPEVDNSSWEVVE